MDKENKRTCFKCGRSPGVDNVKLFRFPKPAIRNHLKCAAWAIFMFPEDQRSASSVFQRKLYNEHRMLCNYHFRDDDYTDITKTRLQITAFPHDGPSQQELLAAHASSIRTQVKPSANRTNSESRPLKTYNKKRRPNSPNSATLGQLLPSKEKTTPDQPSTRKRRLYRTVLELTEKLKQKNVIIRSYRDANRCLRRKVEKLEKRLAEGKGSEGTQMDDIDKSSGIIVLLVAED